MSSTATRLVSLALLAHGAAGTSWPIKTVDASADGSACDLSREQYLKVQVYDYHDHPKFSVTWRQVAGVCGSSVANPKSFMAHYNADAGDSPTTGKVQLNLFACAPHGEYELELKIDSHSDEGSTLEQRTSWEIVNGEDGYRIWDTDSTELASKEEFSPRQPGSYVWPVPGTEGFYSVLKAGPMPPVECGTSVPSGVEYKGCFSDHSLDLASVPEVLELPKEDKGMTVETCSKFCAGFEFFGVAYGYQCLCGLHDDFTSLEASGQCARSYHSLCSGDPRMACGGIDAVDVYRSTNNAALSRRLSKSYSYSYYEKKGCYKDSRRNRIMSYRRTKDKMSADICFDLCKDDDRYTHFGLQYGRECWCSKYPDLKANGDKRSDSECDMRCAGTKTGEKCGDYDRMMAYEMKYSSPSPTPDYDDYESKGCYYDRKEKRIMPDKKTSKRPMSAKICYDICKDYGYTYFGTQYRDECYCARDPDLDRNGGKAPSKDCDMTCDGSKTGEKCGGYDRMSVYSIKKSPPSPSPSPSSYVGCYKDKKSRRAMPDYKYTDTKRMDNKECMSRCKDRGYDYAGTQYSYECWCSDDYDRYGKAYNCDMKCSGDRDEYCGGRDALSVYRTKW